MPVTTFASGDRFTITLTKEVIAEPSYTWQNVYEFVGKGLGVLSDFNLLIATLADFEARLMRPLYRITTGTARTWTADSHPYDPTAFVTVPVGAVGLNPAGAGDPAPLELVLQCYRDGSYGRLGLLELRGVLYMSEVNPAISGWSLDNPSAWIAAVSTAVSASGLVDYLGDTAPVLQMALITATGTPRPVYSLVANQAHYIKLKHKWFNRS